MPAKVILTIATGPCTGQRMEFAERTTCLIGRARECQLRLPQEESHISRYHCLIDINPPEVQVRDLGSRNGTFLNDLKIGQRHPEQTPKEATTELFPSYDLKDGDELRLGPTQAPPTTCPVNRWSNSGMLDQKLMSGRWLPRSITCSPERSRVNFRLVRGVVLETSAKPILQRYPDIPEGLAEVIDRALRDDPQIGFQTVREFQRALKQALEREGLRW